MSDAVVNPPVRSEAKTAKKKKAKAVVEQAGNKPLSVSSAAPSTGRATAGSPTSGEAANGGDGKDYESPYIQELYKSIRNVNKKINATAKLDAILAEHANKTLDELVADRKINNDQKAQALKKPSLQASLAQLQEQVAQYKKFDQDYQKRLNDEKAALRSEHEAELRKTREETRASALKEAKDEAANREVEHILLLSKFLRLAAAKRQEGEADSDEGRALEGLLLMVYGGDYSACAAVNKLVVGAEEPVLSTEHQPLDYTYAKVKESATAYEPYLPAAADDSSFSEPASTGAGAEKAQHLVGTDPTVAHAGLNEDATIELPVNGTSEAEELPKLLQQTTIDTGAANAVAEQHWDAKLSASAEGDGWVEVPRDPAETDTGVTATPAAMSGTQSWADDQPVPAPPVSDAAAVPDSGANANANGNDGFHEVYHSRGGRGRGGPPGERRGSFRGRGGHRGGGEGGGYRGGRGGMRGDRGGGDGGPRGRGRGGFRGGRGRDGPPPPPPRRSDDA